jgi:hypothetical protein
MLLVVLLAIPGWGFLVPVLVRVVGLVVVLDGTSLALA